MRREWEVIFVFALILILGFVSFKAITWTGKKHKHNFGPWEISNAGQPLVRSCQVKDCDVVEFMGEPLEIKRTAFNTELQICNRTNQMLLIRSHDPMFHMTALPGEDIWSGRNITIRGPIKLEIFGKTISNEVVKNDCDHQFVLDGISINNYFLEISKLNSALNGEGRRQNCDHNFDWGFSVPNVLVGDQEPDYWEWHCSKCGAVSREAVKGEL